MIYLNRYKQLIYTQIFIYRKVLSGIIMSPSMEKTFMINLLTLMQNDLKIRKLTTGQGKDYTTGYLLDYDYIKNHYRLVVDDLSRQKDLDADLKTI